MRLTVFVVALAGIALASAQTEKYVGTYEVIQFQAGKAIDNKSLPVGKVLIASLKKSGSFRMSGIFAGYNGTWKLKDKKIEIVISTGPSGKRLLPNHLTMKPAPDRSRLVLVAPKDMAGQLEFRWNQHIVKETTARVKGAIKARKSGD